LKGRA